MATLEKLRVLLLTWFHLRSPSSSVNFLRKFSYKDIKKATDGFRRVVDNSSNGVSYRAKFRNGIDAIVKEIRILNDPDDDDDDDAFSSAVQLMGRLHHRHIAALYGFSTGRKRFLVFEVLEGGSLKDHLSDPLKTPLNWRTRLQIAVGIAAALALSCFGSCITIRKLLERRMYLGEYLHFFCDPPIHHVSISSSTIMLDENLVPKLSDSSLFSATRSDSAPYELPNKENNSDQSSIFQLGLVLLELITGQSSETGGVDLVHWVRESHVPRSINRMIDPDLGNDYNNTELKVLLAVARLCIDSVDEPSSSRNNKSQILRYLKTQIAPTRASARSC